MSEVEDKINALQHAMMTGVGMLLVRDPKLAEPKHVRTGINSAMVAHSALVSLLIDKGIITLEEYHEALMLACEREVAMYEDQLSQSIGTDIHLL